MASQPHTMANDKWMPMADASAIAIAEYGMLNLWDKHSAL